MVDVPSHVALTAALSGNSKCSAVRKTFTSTEGLPEEITTGRRIRGRANHFERCAFAHMFSPAEAQQNTGPLAAYGEASVLRRIWPATPLLFCSPRFGPASRFRSQLPTRMASMPDAVICEPRPRWRTQREYSTYGRTFVYCTLVPGSKVKSCAGVMDFDKVVTRSRYGKQERKAASATGLALDIQPLRSGNRVPRPHHAPCGLCGAVSCVSAWNKSRTPIDITLGCWQADYNDTRPHSQLGWRTPSEFAMTCHPRRDLALCYAEGSAPAPVAATAQPGQSNGTGELRTG